MVNHCSVQSRRIAIKDEHGNRNNKNYSLLHNSKFSFRKIYMEAGLFCKLIGNRNQIGRSRRLPTNKLMVVFPVL